jgi:putative transposase
LNERLCLNVLKYTQRGDFVLRSYKTEINPTLKQKILIHKTIGVCRYIYNFYLAKNREVYQSTGEFLSAYDFEKWLNNEFLPDNLEYSWIKEVSSKAVKQSMINGNTAFMRFFKGKTGFPKFKKKRDSNVKAYFPRNNQTDWIVNRHRVKIPTLKWVRLKEKGYIPTNAKVRNGTVSYYGGKYFVSMLVEVEDPKPQELNSFGLGVDLGVKDFATVSNQQVFRNVNKTKKIRRLEKSLKRQQRKLSRKYESFKTRNNILKGDATRQNIQKQLLKVQKLNYRLTCIRTDYVNKVVNSLVKTKPKYIAIEDLNVKGMLKNRHLSKAIAQQKFFEFRTKLIYKCHIYGIEPRLVDRFYPSSRLCHNCGAIKRDLKLSDRIYKCSCGYTADRDFNASFNLRDCQTYQIK